MASVHITGIMMMRWLMLTTFLWILKTGDAMECHLDENICYIDYSKNGQCKKDCILHTHFGFINVPKNVLNEITLPASLVTTILNIDIVGNISSIPESVQPSLKSVKSINITGSELDTLYISSTSASTLTISDTKISRLTLERQDHLNSIRISNNSLKTFNLPHLRSLPEGEILDLSINKISMFGEAFETEMTNFLLNPRMRHLNLSYNQIVDVHNETFRTMPHLKILDLSHNSIEDLSTEPFHMKNNLVELYLSYNTISLFAVDSFQNLVSLKVLYLDHNNISFLKNGMFTNLLNLLFLDLSCNQLYGIEPEIILPLAHLTELNMYGNHFKEFDFRSPGVHVRSIKSPRKSPDNASCAFMVKGSVIYITQKNPCIEGNEDYNLCCDKNPNVNYTVIPMNLFQFQVVYKFIDRIRKFITTIRISIIILALYIFACIVAYSICKLNRLQII